MDLNDGIEWIPRIGMEFETTEASWVFWTNYAGKTGFNARKFYHNRSPLDGKSTSVAFVCSNEGIRVKDKRDNQPKCPRLETRTGCKVRLVLKLNRKSDKYEVKEFISEHNHMLQLPQACHLLPCTNIELADASGIRPKAAYELMSRQAGGVQHLSHGLTDQKNYLRDRRKATLVHGEAVSILQYFCQQVSDNPSFQHAEQIDDKQEMSNIFWADAQMVIDYAQFGEVIIFDTTHGTNKEHRPFGVFVGFNHFRETVIFGAVLLYDQSIESFTWVFNTFLKAHNSKQPKTIFTDQDAAMGVAIAHVMPNVSHGLCTWHVMQNAVTKLLCHNNSDADYVSEFRACVYEYEEETEFEKAFRDLESKLGGTWLPFIYKVKEKWAYCYMKNSFSLGARSTQLSESLNKDLKYYLKSDLDIVRFFGHFERLVANKREKEVQSEYECRRKIPRVKMNVPILIQMSKRYTPKIFDIFQLEYEMCMTAQIEGPVEKCYIVTIWDAGKLTNDTFRKRGKVFWNPIDQTVSCSCKKFERWGVLCSHALKVLDTMNIKLLPEKYVLKRWTREARISIVRDRNGTIVIDTKLDFSRRNRDLCWKFTKIAAKACSYEQISTFLDGVLDQVDKQVDEKIKNSLDTSRVTGNTSVPPDLMDMLTQNQIRLKKKTGKKRQKRHMSWVENLPKKNGNKTRNKRPLKQQASINEMLSTSDKALDVLESTPNSVRGDECGRLPKEEQKYEINTSFTNFLEADTSNFLPLLFYPSETTTFSHEDIILDEENGHSSSTKLMKPLNE